MLEDDFDGFLGVFSIKTAQSSDILCVESCDFFCPGADSTERTSIKVRINSLSFVFIAVMKNCAVPVGITKSTDCKVMMTVVS